jgi:hypothetical protein
MNYTVGVIIMAVAVVGMFLMIVVSEIQKRKKK